MKVNKNISIGANIAEIDCSLLGISIDVAECTGCGGNVLLLRFGFLFGEIYVTHHKH